jgi:inner membrane protein
MRSDWPHPSFGGRFLPASREVAADGFSARWSVSSLASPAAAEVERGESVCGVSETIGDGVAYPASLPARPPGSSCLDTIDVSFIDPVNPYSLTDRATKYALLFIVLTFAAVALTEVLARRRVHPVQYGLVGLALALFFLLLLSLSEHIAFGQAYVAASAACVALLAYYARHMLGHWRAGLAFGAGVALLYALLWALLRMEQWSLAIGSTLLFAVLAAVMVLTRRIDWYALTASLRQRDAGA